MGPSENALLRLKGQGQTLIEGHFTLSSSQNNCITFVSRENTMETFFLKDLFIVFK